MKRPVRSALAAALLSLGLIAAGCGDTADKNEYVDELNAVQTEVFQDITAINAGASTDPAEAQADVQKLIVAVEDGADKIEAVEPHEDVTEEHAELVSLMRDFAADLQEQADKLDTKDPADLIEAGTKIQELGQEAGTEFDRVIGEINRILQG